MPPFNPTMVRLLRKTKQRVTRFMSSFQSHNGAIAAEVKEEDGTVHVALSIPQWCDCCWHRGFPYRCDRVAFNPTMVRLLLPHCFAILSAIFLLSIPQWCDCCSKRFPDTRNGNCTFNPTMVRLLPATTDLIVFGNSYLSIPQWCDCC